MVSIDLSVQNALFKSQSALLRLANDRLPPALDQRIRELGERKETLSPDDHQELLAWVEFTQTRSIERAEAMLALNQIGQILPIVP